MLCPKKKKSVVMPRHTALLKPMSGASHLEKSARPTKQKPRAAEAVWLPARHAYLLKRSFMPSMSKLRVKRRVWSSGLLLAVAIT